MRMSLRAARRDFGLAGMALVVGAAALVVVLSIASVHRTRALYLSLDDVPRLSRDRQSRVSGNSGSRL